MRFAVLLLAFLALTAFASETESVSSASSPESVSSPESISEPEESVSSPEESVSEPESVSGSEPSEESVSASEPSEESVSEPEESVSSPESVSEPEESVSSPESVSEPEESVSEPETVSASEPSAPESVSASEPSEESVSSVSEPESVSAPESVSEPSEEEESVSEPEESVSEPEESVSEPEESVSEPEESVSEPEEDESASEPSSEESVSDDDEQQQGVRYHVTCDSNGDPHYRSFYNTRWNIYGRYGWHMLLTYGTSKINTYISKSVRWRNRGLNTRVAITMGSRTVHFTHGGRVTGVTALARKLRVIGNPNAPRYAHYRVMLPHMKVEIWWRAVRDRSIRGYYNVRVYATHFAAKRVGGLCMKGRRGRRRRRTSSYARCRAAANRVLRSMHPVHRRRAHMRCRFRRHPCAYLGCLNDYKRGLKRRPRQSNCRRYYHLYRHWIRRRNFPLARWFIHYYHYCRNYKRGGRWRQLAWYYLFRGYYYRFTRSRHRAAWLRRSNMHLAHFKRMSRRRPRQRPRPRRRGCARYLGFAGFYRRKGNKKMYAFYMHYYHKCRLGKKGGCYKKLALAHHYKAHWHRTGRKNKHYLARYYLYVYRYHACRYHRLARKYHYLGLYHYYRILGNRGAAKRFLAAARRH